MWNPFALLRRKAAEAFALGVQDGLDAVLSAKDEPADPETIRAAIVARVAKQLAPPEETDPKPKPKEKR